MAGYNLPEKGVPILRTQMTLFYRAARRRVAATAVAAVLLAAAPALAHHSFTMFDMTKRITLVGTLTS